MKLTRIFFVLTVGMTAMMASAQSLITSMDVAEPLRYNIWPDGKMPNTKLQADQLPQDSIARDRIWRCSNPRIYAYLPTAQESSHSAVVIIPGGGYVKQAYDISGRALAKWFNSMGVTAFVLLHRLPNQPEMIDPWLGTMQDCQRAVRFVRAHAAEFDISPDRIGVMGTSAGAHLSACVSTITEDLAKNSDPMDTVSFRPDFAILVSPIINQIEPLTRGKRHDLCGVSPEDPTWKRLFSIDRSVTSANPPTLLIHAADDPTVPVYNSLVMYNALQQAGVSGSSLHIFPQGKHAIALRHQLGSTALWIPITEQWMTEIGMLP